MFPKLHATPMLTPSLGERPAKRVIPIFLFFFLVYGLGSLGRSAIYVLCTVLFPGVKGGASYLFDLFGTGAVIAAVILWCRFYERRSLLTLGFARRGAVPEYLIGVVGGAVLFGGAVAIAVLGGAATITVSAAQPPLWYLALFFAGFLIQGMSEELLCRSFLMVTLSRRWPFGACAVTNALLFSLLHLGNPGVTFLALLNIFLFGLFASLLTLRRGSIWMAAAIHSLWNFMQGNFFGIPVSGLAGMPAPFVTELHAENAFQKLLGGGAFGIEGGIAATAVLVLGILVVMVVPTKQDTMAPASA